MIVDDCYNEDPGMWFCCKHELESCAVNSLTHDDNRPHSMLDDLAFFPPLYTSAATYLHMSPTNSSPRFFTHSVNHFL